MNRSSWSFVLSGVLGFVLFVSASPSSAAGKPSPKEAKVGVYIGIINAESNHLLQNYEGYTKRVKDLQKGPTCQELGPQSWVSSMGAVNERVAVYRKGLAKQPKLEADSAITEMVDALDALYKPVAEAADYYFLSKFEKDHCKRGLELHPLLMAGWTKYIQAERVVRAFVDKYTDERDATELTAAEKKYGKALHYYHQKLMLDAKALIKVGNARQPDLAELRTRGATLQTTLSDADPVVQKAKKGKDADALYQGGYEQLLHYGGQLKSATDEVIRVLDKEAKDPKSLLGSNSKSAAFGNLLTAYNALVEQSNQTMYTKTMK